MLRTETVSEELLNALHQLMKFDSLRNFRIVGSTALSMQLGHRKSKDIELFCNNEFPTDEICKPEMLNGMTWEDVKLKIETAQKEYFDEIIKDRQKKLKDK